MSVKCPSEPSDTSERVSKEIAIGGIGWLLSEGARSPELMRWTSAVQRHLNDGLWLDSDSPKGVPLGLVCRRHQTLVKRCRPLCQICRTNYQE